MPPVMQVVFPYRHPAILYYVLTIHKLPRDNHSGVHEPMNKGVVLELVLVD
ncbi:hypothetical protein NB701_004098 [Pantoea ananatis]|nr:hypothetical protein [Pantoea ananatis]